MKKKLTLFMLVIASICLILLCGCGNKLSGTWYKVCDNPEYATDNISFESDGTFISDVTGEYVIDGDNVKLIFLGIEAVNYKLTEIDGVGALIENGKKYPEWMQNPDAAKAQYEKQIEEKRKAEEKAKAEQEAKLEAEQKELKMQSEEILKYILNKKIICQYEPDDSGQYDYFYLSKEGKYEKLEYALRGSSYIKDLYEGTYEFNSNYTTPGSTDPSKPVYLCNIKQRTGFDNMGTKDNGVTSEVGGSDGITETISVSETDGDLYLVCDDISIPIGTYATYKEEIDKITIK